MDEDLNFNIGQELKLIQKVGQYLWMKI